MKNCFLSNEITMAAHWKERYDEVASSASATLILLAEYNSV
jgi:hypothetical protein